jgi:hypothetical protein
MNLELLFKNKDKIEKLNKKIKNKIKNENKQTSIILSLTFAVNFIIVLSISLTLKIGIFTVLTSTIGVLFTSLLSLLIFSLWNDYKYPKVKISKLFSLGTKKNEKFFKENKKILKIYEKNIYRDLFLQLLIKKINQSNESEINENVINIKNYLLSMNKDFKENFKTEIKILEKEINNKEDEINNLLNIKKEQKIKLIKNL